MICELHAYDTPPSQSHKAKHLNWQTHTHTTKPRLYLRCTSDMHATHLINLVRRPNFHSIVQMDAASALIFPRKDPAACAGARAATCPVVRTWRPLTIVIWAYAMPSHLHRNIVIIHANHHTPHHKLAPCKPISNINISKRTCTMHRQSKN